MEQIIATDIEQSKRVLACGILGSTADMCWRKNEINPKMNDLIARPPFWEEDIPAWSFSALLALLPRKIYLRSEWYVFSAHFDDGEAWYNFDEECEITPRKFGIKYVSHNYCLPDQPITAVSMHTVYLYWQDGTPLIFEDENPIETCIQALEWISNKKNKVLITTR